METLKPQMLAAMVVGFGAMVFCGCMGHWELAGVALGIIGTTQKDLINYAFAQLKKVVGK